MLFLYQNLRGHSHLWEPHRVNVGPVDKLFPDPAIELSQLHDYPGLDSALHHFRAHQEYWQKGFTGVAKNIADEMDRARELMEQKNLQEMTERNNKREEAIRNKKPGFGSLPPLSPESIARARAEWGISS